MFPFSRCFIIGLSRDSVDTSLFEPDVFIREHLGEEGKLDGQTARRAIKVMAEVS